MSPTPIDPIEGKTFALAGRVVCMDQKLTVLEKGVVYATGGRITAVLKASAAAPDGFEDVEPIQTGGTIYPGLIELHNHLSYNALTLWQVPKKFTNRGQWGSGSVEDYRRLVSAPMKILGPDPEVMPAIVRYVECKAMVAGTTTSQGIQLFSNAGARRYYRGNRLAVKPADQRRRRLRPPAMPVAAQQHRGQSPKPVKRMQHLLLTRAG
jgi:5-methylthioadenosine/S-adenosylhomocysteine deaminase